MLHLLVIKPGLVPFQRIAQLREQVDETNHFIPSEFGFLSLRKHDLHDRSHAGKLELPMEPALLSCHAVEDIRDVEKHGFNFRNKLVLRNNFEQVYFLKRMLA